MRIAQVSTLCRPVRQGTGGSIEGLVWQLSRQLTAMGHEVTVFAAAGSEPCGELVATLPGTYAAAGCPYDWQLCEWINLSRAVEQSGRFDILHSHAYLWGLPLDRLARSPMVHTMHVTPYENEARLWALTPGAHVTAISRYQWSAFPDLHPSSVIYHGVDPNQFTFRAEPQDYVCYLGQFKPGKGPLAAIAVARELGVRLLLAGPANAYYHHHVKPMVDGRMVEYVGFVEKTQRERLLGGARALLYPVQSPEPFGLVLIEAMMCGTPVAAIDMGAVREIVDDGVTGYRSMAPDLSNHVVRAFALDRQQVRDRAEQRFSAERMAGEYAQMYEHVAHEARGADK